MTEYPGKMGTLAAVSANRTAGTPPGDTTATPTNSNPAANQLSTAGWTLINLNFWDIIFFKKSERCGISRRYRFYVSVPYPRIRGIRGSGVDMVIINTPQVTSK